MKRVQNLFVVTILAALVAAVGCGPAAEPEGGMAAGESGGVMVPMFEVDPMWPKNLPNHWLMGPDHRR